MVNHGVGSSRPIPTMRDKSLHRLLWEMSRTSLMNTLHQHRTSHLASSAFHTSKTSGSGESVVPYLQAETWITCGWTSLQ